MKRPDLRELRDLDARLVPQAAARLRALVGALGARREALRSRLDALSDPLPSGAVPGPLRRLDERLVEQGPLAVLARSPQWAALVLCALLLVGTSVALSADDGALPGQATTVGREGVLGPDVGTVVDDYVAAARRSAVQASRERPDVEHLALISLAEYARPEQVALLVEGLQVERAYLRVPSAAPTEVLAADVADLAADLEPLYAATAARKAEDAEELASLSTALPPDAVQAERFRAFYDQAAALARLEADAFASGCACVFAVVVRGPASLLAAAPALSGVRAVELGLPGTTLEEVLVQPLLPEQVDVVEEPAAVRPPEGLPGGTTVPGS